MTTYNILRPRHATATIIGRYQTRDHTVVGTLDQLDNITRNHLRAGTLVASTPPRPGRAGRYYMVIRVREYQSGRPRPITTTGTSTAARRRRHTAIGAVIAVVVGLVTVVAYLIGQLVQLIIDHAVPIAVALAVLGLLAARLGRRVCIGIHCPGCKHH